MTTFAQESQETQQATAPAQAPAADQGADQGRAGLRAMVPGLLLDAGLPAGGYFVLHELCGMSNVLALTVGGALSAVRVLYTVVRTRRVDGFAAFILGLFAISLGLTFLTGDPHFVLVKDSFGTGIAGLAFLVTCVLGKPLTHLSTLRFMGTDPQRRAQLEDLQAHSTGYRALQRNMSLLWGFGLLVEAGARVVLVYLLPFATVVALSTALQIVFLVALTVGSALLAKRFRLRLAHR